MHVALFGGSFDPPHVGHVLGVAYALSVGGFDRALVVPVFAHAFGKDLAPFAHRVAMTRLAMAGLRDVEVSTIEEELGAPSQTLKTVEHLLRDQPGCRFDLVVGADALTESSQWHAFDQIVARAPLFVLGRVGVAHPDAPLAMLPDVSSTRVRELLRSRSGARTEDADLRRLVPRSVLAYVDEHGLYR